MAINPYFKKYSGDASIIEDLTIETIKAMGHDFIYIPRTLVNVDELFGEDTISRFDDGYELEMYIQNVDGFEGEGDILTKFGLEIRDRMTLVLSKSRFENTIGIHEGEITKPREGDLVYFPLSKTLFEINFVEHENPFYQLGKLYTYKLSCELFQYSQEDLNTGWSDVDTIEDTHQDTTMNLVFSASTGSFVVGESITTVSGFSAKVVAWAGTTNTLVVHNLSGTLSGGDTVTGSSSSATGTFQSQSAPAIPTIIPNASTDPFDASDDMQVNADDIFDFTDIDPFSDGGY